MRDYLSDNRACHGRNTLETALVKVGGSTLDSNGLLDELAKDMVRLGSGRSILLHGGGKDISRALEQMGQTTEFIDGLRVTDYEAIRTVEMVLSAQVNKRIVRSIIAANGKAVGLSGVDGGLFTAEQHGDPRLGHVGQVVTVHPEIITTMLEHDFLPVVSPISLGVDGETYNVNADHAAVDLATTISATDLVYITDVPGVLVESMTMPALTVADVENLIAAGQITGGMIPKVRSCAQAVLRGVERVHIIAWQGSHTLTEHLRAGQSHGTVITKN